MPRYAPLLSEKAIEKLTKDHGYEPRTPQKCEVVSKDRVLGRQVESLRSNEDFPYWGDLHRGWTKRMALLEAQNHRCAYCGIRVKTHGNPGADNHATIDHVVPFAARGVAIWSNEVIACWLCNQGRGAMYAERYFAKVQKVGRWMAFHWGVNRAREASKQKPPVLVFY